LNATELDFTLPALRRLAQSGSQLRRRVREASDDRQLTELIGIERRGERNVDRAIARQQFMNCTGHTRKK
jgi:hypothetical protein